MAIRVLSSTALALTFGTGCAQTHRAADFSGTWTGEAVCVNTAGSPTTEQTLTIEIGEGGRARGTLAWRSLGTGGGHDPEGEVVREDREDLIGIVSARSGTMALVETGESGTHFARMLPDGRLELLCTQPGEMPVVTLATLSKQGDPR